MVSEKVDSQPSYETSKVNSIMPHICNCQHESLCLTYGNEPDQLDSVCRTDNRVYDRHKGPRRPRAGNMEPEVETANG